MNPEKVIFMSITHGFQARTLLRTDVLKILKNNGIKVVIFTPNWNEEYFLKEFTDSDVVIEKHIGPNQRLNYQVWKFGLYVIPTRKLNSTINRKSEELRKKYPGRFYFVKLFNGIADRLGLIRSLWFMLDGMVLASARFGEMFDKYKPAAVVTGTPGVHYYDAAILWHAKRRGVKTICQVLSWDNLTSKGYMRVKPDKLITWNEIMKAEAVEYHDFKEENIHVAGVSHFDIYSKPQDLGTREEVFNRLGLDINRRLITYGTSGPSIFARDDEVIKIIHDAIIRGKLVKPAQLLVRLHPQSVRGMHAVPFEVFPKLPHVFYDRPQVLSEDLPWDLPAWDMRHLAEVLYHSHVVLNVASTFAIDACALDRPVIGIGFDGYEKKDYAHSVLRRYDDTHYKNIVQTGGTRIASSPDELIDQINKYLENPRLDSEGRSSIIEQQCYKLDGRSSQRVAEYILQEIGEAT